MKSSSVFFSLALVFALFTNAKSFGEEATKTTKDYTQETPAARAARLQWWTDARFGMFIHWGLYSEAAGYWNGKPTPHAGEWIMHDMAIPDSQYAKLVPEFDPEKFNAREWVRIAKKAGMKYIVITSKHHEGFGMFRSDLTDWCIKSTPFQRDPLKELAAACQAEGIKLCFYYSIMDWHNPDYAPPKPWNDLANPDPDFDKYVAFMKGELKELLTNYGPIGILWFDGEWDSSWTPERGKDLYNYVRSLQPDIIVNNRVTTGRSGMKGMTKNNPVGDYGTPEQQIPAMGFGPGVYWESCMTMNDTWGYKRNDNDWKSAETLVHNLVDCASEGGNYLLNVGPTGEGVIPGPSVERLAEVGAWMKVNGEAIYGTTASPFPVQFSWGRCTKKETPDGTTLYLHVFKWPKDGKLVVPELMNRPTEAYLLKTNWLGWHKKLETTNSTGSTTNAPDVAISVPQNAPDKFSTTIVLKIKGAPQICSLLLD